MVQQRLIGRIAVAVAARFENFNRGTRQASRGTRLTSREIARLRREARQASTQVRALGSRLRGLTGLGAGVFAGFGVAEVTRGTLAFDREINKIITLVGVAREQVQAWRGDIVEIAKQTGILPQELSPGLFNIASIGLQGQEAMEALNVIARATAVGLGDFATVADAVTRIMGAYRNEALSAAEAADALSVTIALGNDAPEDFVLTYQRVVAQAAAADISLQDLAASMAFLTTAGFRARDAGTGLAQLFFRVIQPTKEAAIEINNAGLSLDEFRKLITDDLIQGLVELEEVASRAGVPLGRIFTDKEALNVVNTVVSQSQRAVEFQERFRRLVVGASERGFNELAVTASFELNRALREITVNLQEWENRILPSIAEYFRSISAFALSLVAFFGLILPAARGIGTLFRGFVSNRAAVRAVREEIKDLQREQKELIDSINELDMRVASSTERSAAYTAALDRNRAQLSRLRQEQVAFTLSIGQALEGLGGFLGFLGTFAFLYSLLGQDQAAESVAKVDEEALKLAETQRRLVANQELLNRLMAAGFDGTSERVRIVRERIANLFANIPLDDLGRLDAPTMGVPPPRLFAEEEVPVVPNVVFPRSAIPRFVQDLRRQVEDAQFDLDIGDLSAGAQEAARQQLELQRFVQDGILDIERRRADTNRVLSEERRKGEGADEQILVNNEAILANLREQRDELLQLLSVDSERGALIADLIETRAAAAQAEQDSEAAARRTFEAEQESARIASERARLEAEIYRGKLVGQRAGENLVMQARQELEIARLTTRLRGNPASQINAEIAVLQARQQIDIQRLGVLRRIEDAQEDLERQERRGNEASIRYARDRLSGLEAELESIGALNESWARYAEIQGEIAEINELQEQQRQIEGFLSTIGSSFEEAIAGWAVAAESGKQIFRSLVRTVVTEAIKFFAVRQILGAIFGAVGGGFNSASLLGTSDFQGFHQGGLAQRGFAVVGERGPELIDFRRPSRVYSNEDLAGAIGTRVGNTFVYSPQVSNVPGLVRGEMARAYPGFVQGVKGELSADAGDRSSRFRQSFAR